MTDRLAELQVDTETSLSSSKSHSPDCEGGDSIDEETREALEKFHKETDAISAAIERVQETIGDIESRYADSLVMGRAPDARLLAERDIARLLQENEKRGDAIRKRLRRIAGENKMFAGEHAEKTGELRVRVNTHQGLTRRFMTAMQTFEEVQNQHTRNVQSAMESKLRAINPDASDDEIRVAVSEGHEEWIIGNSKVMSEMPIEEQQKLRNGLEDLRSRNNDLKNLEASIVKLHQLFVDMQNLVDAQGELLNNIEYNVDETKGATAAALDELVEARNHQKSAHKKKCVLIALLVILFLGGLSWFLAHFIPKWLPDSEAAKKIQEAECTILNNCSSTGNETLSETVRIRADEKQLAEVFRPVD